MIGIYMRYQRCESAWIGLQIASWLRAMGYGCSVLSLGSKGPSVHPEWDDEVKTDYVCDFTSWIKKCSHVMWFNDVSPHDVERVKGHKIKTIMLASWDDPVSKMAMYKMADKVICFSPSLAARLRKGLSLSNIMYSPLDIYTLHQSRSIMLRPDRPRVLLNLRGPRKHQLGSQLAPIFVRWFKHVPAEWTIWVRKSLLHKKAWIHKCLKSTHSYSSFRFESAADWDTQRLLYGWTDLTVWPTLHGGHGLTVLMSLTMGAPIATFDIPPSNEYVNKDNSILAPCQVRYNSNGTTQLVPDLLRYENIVNRYVSHSELLRKLKQHTGDWADERKQLFDTAWKEILS